MDITIPEYLAKIKSYVAGKPISEVQAEYGITNPIKLASNENALGPSPKALEAIKKTLCSVHIYPDSYYRSLRQKLADSFNVESQQIILGNGSDEVMSFIGQALLLPEEEVIVPHPAFSIYEKIAIMSQARLKKIPLKDMAIDLQAIVNAISPKTKLIFLTNPHNPTGSFLGRDQLIKFLRQIPSATLVVLDEAYVDFVSETNQFDSVDLIKSFPNLIILRTFSKAYGLAGLRIGYGVFSLELAEIVEKVRLPFNVNLLAQVAAEAALDDKEFLEKTRQMILKGRHFLTEGLQALGIRVYPSEANFVMIHVGPQAHLIYKELLKRGIIVRPLDNYDLPEFLRITIGTLEQNKEFLMNFIALWKKLSLQLTDLQA